jgi:hypothetical protein
MVSVQGVICQGWGRGLDLWCWASKFETVRARECDVGFYYWTGTTTVFQNTYAQTCQTGYLIGGDKDTAVGDNTDTPGTQNPYPPHRPIGINFIGTAADDTATHAYYVNDSSATTFTGVASEGTGLGMFRIDKSTGSITIENPKHATTGGSFVDADHFVFFGQGIVDVDLNNAQIDGAYTVAIFDTNAPGATHDSSLLRLTKFFDFSTGAGAGIINTNVDINGAVSIASATTVVTIPQKTFKYADELTSSIVLSISGTVAANSNLWLGVYSFNLLIGGKTSTSNKVLLASNFTWGQIFGVGGDALNSIAISSVTSDSANIYVTMTMSSAVTGSLTIDANSNKANYQQLNHRH